MTPLEHIRLHEHEFTKSDRIIMDYVIDHLDIIASYPLVTVAEKAKVSKSALLRFCQKCGYDGYTEFKYEVSRYLHSGNDVSADASIVNSTLLTTYANSILSLEQYVKESELVKTSSLVQNARKIKLYGVHETGLSAQYFQFRLNTLGIDAEAITLPSSITDKVVFSRKGDLNIFLSLSATTECILDAIKTSLDNHSGTILITQNDHLKLLPKFDTYFIVPTLNNLKTTLFLDSQAILLILIELIINHLARTLNQEGM